MDGRNDILVGQTRHNPYYVGRYLQLLINKGNGVFVEESSRIPAGDRPLQQGEGPIRLADLNDDGFLDIIDGASPDVVLINDGTGHYERIPEGEIIPRLDVTDLTQFQSLEYENQEPHGLLAPIQLDGQGPLEFVASFPIAEHLFPPRKPGDKNQVFLYTINSVEPFQPSPLEPLPIINLSATELSFAGPLGINPAAQQITIANSGLGDLEWTAVAASEGDWLGVSPTAGEEKSILTVTAVSEELAAGVYEGTVSVQVAAAVNSPQIVSVRLTVGSPAFTSESFVNAASYATGRFASEMWVALYGRNLASELIVAKGLPTSLGGVSISITDSQGVQRLAELQFVHPERINFLTPAGLALGPAVVEVTNTHGETASAILQIEAVAPGLFSANASGQGPAAATFLLVDWDGTRTEGLTFDGSAPVGQRNNVQVPRYPQLYLSFFGTGFRNQSSVSVRERDRPEFEIPVLAAVAQGVFDGLDQVVIGPFPYPPPYEYAGESEFIFTFDGVETNEVSLWVD